MNDKLKTKVMFAFYNSFLKIELHCEEEIIKILNTHTVFKRRCCLTQGLPLKRWQGGFTLMPTISKISSFVPPPTDFVFPFLESETLFWFTCWQNVFLKTVLRQLFWKFTNIYREIYVMEWQHVEPRFFLTKCSNKYNVLRIFEIFNITNSTNLNS